MVTTFYGAMIQCKKTFTLFVSLILDFVTNINIWLVAYFFAIYEKIQAWPNFISNTNSFSFCVRLICSYWLPNVSQIAMCQPPDDRWLLDSFQCSLTLGFHRVIIFQCLLGIFVVYCCEYNHFKNFSDIHGSKKTFQAILRGTSLMSPQ